MLRAPDFEGDPTWDPYAGRRNALATGGSISTKYEWAPKPGNIWQHLDLHSPIQPIEDSL